MLAQVEEGGGGENNGGDLDERGGFEEIAIGREGFHVLLAFEGRDDHRDLLDLVCSVRFIIRVDTLIV